MNMNLKILETLNPKNALFNRRVNPKKYVSIDLSVPVDAYNELYKAQDILANYAKAKKVKIGFNSSNPAPQNNITVSVSRKKKPLQHEDIPADVNAIYVQENCSKYALFNKAGRDFIADGIERREDTFLRHVYRVIEKLTKQAGS